MNALRFDPEAMRALWEATRHDRTPQRWTLLDAAVMAAFWQAPAAADMADEQQAAG